MKHEDPRRLFDDDGDDDPAGELDLAGIDVEIEVVVNRRGKRR
jgi:hypothetical protein